MAQSAEELQKAKTAIDAQAALIRSQADLIKAQGELSTAQTPPNAAVQAANAEKARIDAAKALVDARQGLSTSTASADLAAAQATIGTVNAAAGAPTGTVTVGTNAGKGESTLLASRAVNLAAGKIAARIDVAGKTVVLMSGLDSPQFANYQQFEIRQDIIVRMLQKAVDAAAAARARGDALKPRAAAAEGAGPRIEAVPLLAGVGVALDALNKLGGYFRSDFSIVNIDVTGDSVQLVSATGGALLDLENASKRPAAIIAPAVAIAKVGDLRAILKPLLDGMQPVSAAAAALQSEGAAARSAADAEKDAAVKARWVKAAEAYETALPTLTQAQTRADEFISGLSAADSSGVMLLTKILRERFAYTQLQGTDKLALYVDIRATAGGAYSKKNLWTLFGELPFYAMGGIVAAYSLVDPSTGGLKASGVVPIHGGYHKVKKVAAVVGN